MRRVASTTVGRLAAEWARAVARTATLRVIGAEAVSGTGDSCGSLAEQLLCDAQQGHVMVPFWSADQMTIALLAEDRFGLRPALDRFEVVADDSFGGRMMHVLGERMALKMRPIHGKDDPRRLQDLGAWLRKPAPFFIAVDGGTAYGRVPTGTIRLAARLRSRLWPVAVRAHRSFRLPGLVAEIPLRGAAIVLAIGTPMVVEREMPVQGAADELEHRLHDAVRAADEVLARARPSVATEELGAAPSVWRRTG